MALTTSLLVLLAAIVYYLIRLWRGRRSLPHAAQVHPALDTVLAAYRRGDYQTALRQAEGLKRGSSTTAPYCYFRGKMLYELGQLPESEASFREALGFKQDQRLVALTWESLGYALLEQQRYPDAIASFEACIQDAPDRGSGHRAIAEVWLRQNSGTAEALSRARRAVEMERAAKVVVAEVHNLNLAEALATLAWAVAADSHDAADVERLLTEAFPLCGEDTKPILAQIHYHAGRAYAALGLSVKSAAHFQQAAAVDPCGNFGRLAGAIQG